MTATKTYNVTEVKELFNLETAGDAWNLIIDMGWECVQPLPDTKWQITIPAKDLPRAKRPPSTKGLSDLLP